MLVRFSVSNFRSFRDQTILNLEASSINDFEEKNVIHTDFSDLRALKSLVLFGYNSSGKSNLFKAMVFMRWFILNSSKDFQASEAIDVQSFLFSTQTAHKPSTFEIEMLIGQVIYKYGFTVDNSIVHKEWLYFRKKTKEYQLFKRNQQDIVINEKFESNQQIAQLTRENALFLSVASQFNIEKAKLIIAEINKFKFFSGLREERHIQHTVSLYEEDNYRPLLKELIRGANLGFSDFSISKFELTKDMFGKHGMPDEVIDYFLKDNSSTTEINTIHDVYDENNKSIRKAKMSLMTNESLGTRKFFSLAGPIVHTLVNGGVLIVDEFTSKMNPTLSESIMKLFNSKENNPNNAQFLFTTHNTRFVDRSHNLFRRDQMLCFKKDEFGASQVQTMFDIRARKDASFEKIIEVDKSSSPKIDLSGQLSLF